MSRGCSSQLWTGDRPKPGTQLSTTQKHREGLLTEPQHGSGALGSPSFWSLIALKPRGPHLSIGIETQ